jgi:hypothetical protein
LVQYGARFIPKGGFDGVHLASDPFTAILEVEAVFITAAGRVVSDINPPWTWVTVEGVVENVVDLTDSVLWDRFVPVSPSSPVIGGLVRIAISEGKGHYRRPRFSARSPMRRAGCSA